MQAALCCMLHIGISQTAQAVYRIHLGGSHQACVHILFTWQIVSHSVMHAVHEYQMSNLTGTGIGWYDCTRSYRSGMTQVIHG